MRRQFPGAQSAPVLATDFLHVDCARRTSVAAGVEVIAVARAEQTDQLRDLGAALAVERGDYTAQVRQHYPNGVDAAIDLVGGAAAHTAFDLVRDGGRYVTSVPPYIDPDGRSTPRAESRFSCSSSRRTSPN